MCDFIIDKMLGASTAQTEMKILENNFNMVTFLASRRNGTNNLSVDDWQAIFDTDTDILEYSKKKTDGFNFNKKTAQKSKTNGSKIADFSAAIREMSVGVASKDLPFGLLPSDRISDFVNKLKQIYPKIASEFDVLNVISKDCLVCMIKGFKPAGDDNRPDRGVLPLVAMLTSEKIYVLSYIYGPLIEQKYRLLLSDPMRLTEISGFWRAFLSLSDFLLLDAPLLNTTEIVNNFIDNRNIKRRYISKGQTGEFVIPAILNVPNCYREDDVDTVLHYMFSYLLENTFEGMCNPPGGDWSGFSVRVNNCEYRWLSLLRVSGTGKRPDYVAELFIPDSKPILFVIESKERGNNLESDIGIRLKGYIHWLMNFSPSVSKLDGGEWRDTEEIISTDMFEIISTGAYINDDRYDNQQIIQKSKCDLLFLFTPDEENGFWKIKILANAESKGASKIQRILLEQLAVDKDGIFITTTNNNG